MEKDDVIAPLGFHVRNGILINCNYLCYTIAQCVWNKKGLPTELATRVLKCSARVLL